MLMSRIVNCCMNVVRFATYIYLPSPRHKSLSFTTHCVYKRINNCVTMTTDDAADGTEICDGNETKINNRRTQRARAEKVHDHTAIICYRLIFVQLRGPLPVCAQPAYLLQRQYKLQSSQSIANKRKTFNEVLFSNRNDKFTKSLLF